MGAEAISQFYGGDELNRRRTLRVSKSCTGGGTRCSMDRNRRRYHCPPLLLEDVVLTWHVQGGWDSQMSTLILEAMTSG